MRLNEQINGIRRAGLAVLMLLGVGLAASSTAQAQYRDYDQYGYGRYDGVRWDGEREKRFAYVLGYHESYSEGRDAVGYRTSYRDMPSYRDGMNGWSDWMGSRGTYRDYYRKGYVDGFTDAQNYRPRRYDRNDVERALGASLQSLADDQDYPRGRGDGGWDGYDRRYDRDGYDRRYDRDGIMHIAEQNGYRDGFQRGQYDIARGRRPVFDDSDRFCNDTSGYRSEYGDLELYRQAYRKAYHRGYAEGCRNGGYGLRPRF